MMLWVVIAAALVLRIATLLFLAPSGVEDGYTWWILAVETKHNGFIYTDPWGFHDRLFPPLYAVVSSLFMALVDSEDLWVPRVVSIICGVVGVALTYLITKQIVITKSHGGGDSEKWSLDNAPLVAALLLAFNPFHIFYTAASVNEALFSAFIFAGLYFFLKIEKANLYYLPAAGFLFLATLTRYEAWVLMPFFAWIAIKQDRVTPKKLFLSGTIVLLGPLVWMLRQQVSYGSWRNFIEHYLTGGGAATSSIMGGPYLNALFVLLQSGGLTLGLSWFGLIYGWKKLVGPSNVPPRSTMAFDKRNFELLYIFLAAYLLMMILLAGLGISPSWTRYHVAYFPAVFVVFGIGFVDKILPLLKNIKFFKFPANRRSVGAALLLVPLLLTPIFSQRESQRQAMTGAAEALARNYQGGRIISDIPSIIYHSGLPIKIFLNSDGIPDPMHLWGAYLKSNDIRYLVWTDSGYARISYFGKNEEMIRKGETNLKFSLLHQVARPHRKTCRIYKIVDYGA